MPNIEELVSEINLIENPEQVKLIDYYLKNIFTNNAVSDRLARLISIAILENPALYIIHSTLMDLQMAGGTFLFELGRLYGRSQLIEELENEKTL